MHETPLYLAVYLKESQTFIRSFQRIILYWIFSISHISYGEILHILEVELIGFFIRNIFHGYLCDRFWLLYGKPMSMSVLSCLRASVRWGKITQVAYIESSRRNTLRKV